MSSLSKKLLLPVATLCAAGALTACGGGDDTTSEAGDPAAAVEVFLTAVANADGEAACAYVSAADIEKVETTSGGTCEESFGALASQTEDDSVDAVENATYETTDQTDTTATVSVTIEGEDPETIGVVLEDGVWKVAE